MRRAEYRPQLLSALAIPRSQGLGARRLTHKEGFSSGTVTAGHAAVLALHWVLEKPRMAAQLWEGAWNRQIIQSGWCHAKAGPGRDSGKNRGQPTSILRLDGDDALTLWPEALGCPGLHLELVRNVLTEARYGQPALKVVSIHPEGPGWSYIGKTPSDPVVPSHPPTTILFPGQLAPPPWAISQVTR